MQIKNTIENTNQLNNWIKKGDQHLNHPKSES